MSDVTLSVCFPGLEVWGALGVKSTVFSYQSELSLGVIRAELLDTIGQLRLRVAGSHHQGCRFKSRHSSLLVRTAKCSWYIHLPVRPLSIFGFSGTSRLTSTKHICTYVVFDYTPIWSIQIFLILVHNLIIQQRNYLIHLIPSVSNYQCD